MTTKIINNLKISNTRYAWGWIEFIDMTNAGRRGKLCEQISIQINNLEQTNNEVSHNMSIKLDEIRTIEQARDFAKLAKRSFDFIKLHENTIKSITIFPENDLIRIKKLATIPKKFKVADVVKALVNNQFKNLRCAGKYSDDYYNDAMTNYGAGPIDSAIDFAKKLYEDKGGWWSSIDENMTVSINCHHFDSNRFELVI